MDETGQPGAPTPGEHGNGAGPQGDPARPANGWAADAGWSGAEGEADTSGRQWRQPAEPAPGPGWADRPTPYGPFPGPPADPPGQPANGAHPGEATDAERGWPGGRPSPAEPGHPYGSESDPYARSLSGHPSPAEDHPAGSRPPFGGGEADVSEPAHHGYAEREPNAAQPAPRWSEPAHGHPRPTSAPPAGPSPYGDSHAVDVTDQRPAHHDPGPRERIALLPAASRQSERVPSPPPGDGPGGAENGSGGGPDGPNAAGGAAAEARAQHNAWSAGWAPPWAAPSPVPTGAGEPVSTAGEPADEPRARGGGHRRDTDPGQERPGQERSPWSPPSWADQSVQRLPVQRQPVESVGSGGRDNSLTPGRRDEYPHQPAYRAGLGGLSAATPPDPYHAGASAQPEPADPGSDAPGYPFGPGGARVAGHPEPSGHPTAGGHGRGGGDDQSSPAGYGSAHPAGYPHPSSGGHGPAADPTRREAPGLAASGGAAYPRPNPHPTSGSTPVARPAEQGVDALPQRIPAEPDVPTVPEPPVAEPPAETPELARIATHLRREDRPVPPRERPDGFDVDAIVAAVRGVPGVRDASVRTTPAGAHSLRLDLADGADPAEVSRRVARLLQERMGLAAAPRNLPAPAHAGSGRGRTSGATGQARHAPPAASRAGDPGHGGPSAAAPGAYGPSAEATRRRRQSPPRGRAAGGEHGEGTPDPGQGAAGPSTVGAYSGSPMTTTETAPSRPLNPGSPPGPRVVIDHVQVSTFGLDATVEVRLAAGNRPAAGLATGPAVDGYVLRLCAVAAAAAIDELLSSSSRVTERGRCFVEHAAVVPFGSCEVATVVVLLVCDGWVEQLAGSALVAGDPRQAVVRATLAAVNRRLEALLA